MGICKRKILRERKHPFDQEKSKIQEKRKENTLSTIKKKENKFFTKKKESKKISIKKKNKFKD